MPLALTQCTIIIWPQRTALLIAVIIGSININIQLQSDAIRTTTMARKRNRNTRHKKSTNNNSNAPLLAAPTITLTATASTTTTMTATSTATIKAATTTAATTTTNTRAAGVQLNDKYAQDATTMRDRRPSHKVVKHILNGFEYVSVNPATLPKMQNDDVAHAGRKRCVNCGQEEPYLVLDLRADMHMRHILLKIFQKTLAETEHVLQAMCANCDINIRLQQDKILLERMRKERRKSRNGDAVSHDGSIKQKSQQNTFDGESTDAERMRNGATPLMNGHSCPDSRHCSPISVNETHTVNQQQQRRQQQQQQQQKQRAKSVVSERIESETAAMPKRANKVNQMSRRHLRARRYTHIGYRDKSSDRILADRSGARMTTRSRAQSRYFDAPLALETETEDADDVVETRSISPTESVQKFLEIDDLWHNDECYDSDREITIERRTTRAVKSRLRANKNKREYRLFRKTIQEIDRTRRRNRWKYRTHRGFQHFHFVTDRTQIEQHRRRLDGFRTKFHHAQTNFPTDDELLDDARQLKINTFRDYDIYLFERLKEQANMGIFRCSVPGCVYLTRKIEHLAAHDYAAHTTNGTFTCKTCGDKFSKIYFLYYHYFMLEKDEYYFCHLCEQVFTFIVDYQCHLRAHELNTNYGCTTCDLRFVSVHDLNSHCNERQHSMYALQQQQEQQQQLRPRLRKRPRIHIQQQLDCNSPAVATRTTTAHTQTAYTVYVLNINAPLTDVVDADVDVDSSVNELSNFSCRLLFEPKMPLQVAYRIGRLSYDDYVSPIQCIREKLNERRRKEVLYRRKYKKRRRKFVDLLRKLQLQGNASNGNGTRRRTRAKSRLKT